MTDEELARKSGGAGALLARLRADGVWGAGDVVHGAFALALMEGQSEEAALAFASAAAAVRCETGRLPDRPAVEQLLLVPPVRGGG